MLENATSQDAGRPASACRILIVDDNRDAADSLGAVLRILKNDVRIAYDGARAVDLAVEFEPEVILLDIGLPIIDGYQVARRIRDLQGGGVMLVALTGWGQEEDRRRAFAAGFNHHMTKPVRFDVLQELLANLPS